MATIAENLQKIANSKAAIKQAISDRGGTITDSTPLDEYAQAVEDLPKGKYISEVETVDAANFKNFLDDIESIKFPVGSSPAQIISNGNGSTYPNTTLKKIDFSNFVFPATYIGTTYAGYFSGLKALEQIKNADFSNITRFGNHTFYNCFKLDILTLNLDFSKIVYVGSNALTCLGKNIYTSENAPNISLPNCTDYYSYPFEGCYFKSLEVNFNRIYWDIFGSSPLLETAIFGNNLTKIDDEINTYKCSSLTTFIFKSTVPPQCTASYPFDSYQTANNSNYPVIQHVYVPAASVQDYKEATGWIRYASIIEANPNE